MGAIRSTLMVLPSDLLVFTRAQASACTLASMALGGAATKVPGNAAEPCAELDDLTKLDAHLEERSHSMHSNASALVVVRVCVCVCVCGVIFYPCIVVCQACA